MAVVLYGPSLALSSGKKLIFYKVMEKFSKFRCVINKKMLMYKYINTYNSYTVINTNLNIGCWSDMHVLYVNRK